MYRYLAVFALVSLALCGCQSSGEPSVPADPVVGNTGQVRYLDFEGGFYGIVGDDGGHWLPSNLPAEFRHDHLRVVFEARITDLPNTMMWGRTVEIVTITEHE
jgi:hypothetical protein